MRLSNGRASATPFSTAHVQCGRGRVARRGQRPMERGLKMLSGGKVTFLEGVVRMCVGSNVGGFGGQVNGGSHLGLGLAHQARLNQAWAWADRNATFLDS